MGSTTPPHSSKGPEHPEALIDPSRKDELERLLKIKDHEIRLLKYQLEKYKLALSQSQVEQQQQQHQQQQQQQQQLQLQQQLQRQRKKKKKQQQQKQPTQQMPLVSESSEIRSASDNNKSLLAFPQIETNYPACATAQTIVNDVVGQFVTDDEQISDILPVEASLSKESPSHSRLLSRQSTLSAGSAISSSGKALFKAGTDDDDVDFDDDDDDDDDDNGDDDDDDDDDNGDNNDDDDDDARNRGDNDDEDDDDDDGHKHGNEIKLGFSQRERIDSATRSDPAFDIIDDELYNVIQDVGEIDLNTEFKRKRKRKTRTRAMSLSADIKSYVKIDTAQLRARARRNESQDQNDNHDEDIISDGLLTSLTDAAINNLSQLAALQERCESQDSSSHPHYQEPDRNINPEVSTADLFKSHPSTSIPLTSIKSSATAAATAASSTCMRSQGRHSQQTNAPQRDLDSYNLHNPFSATNLANQAALAISAAAAAMQQDPTSSSTMLTHSPSSSISPNSTIHADLNSGQSLASVVAAAAVAAAAANDQQQQHQQSHHTHDQAHPAHQLQSTPQSRLISSALSSPEFYLNLHQQHQRSQAQTQLTNMPHQMSPLSALHAYSPATPISPSPSSLLAHSRRSGSNASSSFMSPISSPNFLSRQFMPERFPMMSPSPSLTTGSNSAASTSLAHILQQNHQQRSVSALAGSITSPSSTPLSGTGSSVMSPLMGSKNSSQARLNNMQIRHKFGYLGSGRGQFNSPHGFCLGLNQEIVVADTNNHRICIFDKSGSYITQFGSAGKDEGQLWNPRKVAILHRTVAESAGSGVSHQRQMGQMISAYSSGTSGIQNANSGSNQITSEPLYVVCDRGAERSRMQLFTKDGSFIKKIAIHYIDIVAGLAITQSGLIIVVDSVSPTVYIINAETGTLNGWFDCSGHMKEPSDIAVKSEVPSNEYFICDFKGHCVVVFNEQGEYLRKIGHDGLTSYPNGIDISDDGDILVGDSHGNRFHVVVFDRNGNFVSQFECPHVKVSRCCGLKITREGYIVTLAKNNHHVLVLDTIHI